MGMRKGAEIGLSGTRHQRTSAFATKHKLNRPTTTATRLRFMTSIQHYHAMGTECSTIALHCAKINKTNKTLTRAKTITT